MTIHHPLISVIIPVYNTEPYLRKCLDSVCGQTYRNLEIICVNDGSTDASASILEEYAFKDPRITVISQQNAGQSAARNAALKIAHGEWITGVDSDDYLEPDAYEYALGENTNHIDIICFGTNVIRLNQEKESHLLTFFEIREIKDCSPSASLIKETNDSFWNKLWRKEFIDKQSIRFPIGLWYEDSFFWRAAAPFAEKIRYLTEKKINYVRRCDSTMSKIFNKEPKTMDRVHIAEHLLSYYQAHPLPSHLRQVQLDSFLFCISCAFSDVPRKLHPQVWKKFQRLSQEYDMLKHWPHQLNFLKSIPLLLRPFVHRTNPNKTAYGIPGFRPLVIQKKNGMRIVRFLGIKLSRKPI